MAKPIIFRRFLCDKAASISRLNFFSFERRQDVELHCKSIKYNKSRYVFEDYCNSSAYWVFKRYNLWILKGWHWMNLRIRKDILFFIILFIFFQKEAKRIKCKKVFGIKLKLRPHVMKMKNWKRAVTFMWSKRNLPRNLFRIQLKVHFLSLHWLIMLKLLKFGNIFGDGC